ncbi:MAG TPA: MarR family winged helix-turn-helix transcriptional regulator [Trebonia sp.]|jgi:DNA-binding MarR family transcriptional regulator|nr:MarR family winged helix-turn-helix transcriptional regulator [Trebonia sp.]
MTAADGTPVDAAAADGAGSPADGTPAAEAGAGATDKAEAPDPIQLFDDLVRAETRLYNLVDERVRTAHGATIGQVQTLGFIDRTENARVDDIGRYIDVRAGTASKIVDRLVAADWVRRTANPHDRRSSWLELTDAGARLLREATPTFETAVRGLTAGALSAGELRTLAATLSRLRATLFSASGGDNSLKACSRWLQ